VALVRTYVSEERIASIIRVKGISKQGVILAVTGVLQLVVTVNAVLSTLMMEAIRSWETPVLTRAKRLIPEDVILHNHRREDLKSYLDFYCSFVSRKAIDVS
jgi:hypothetical protein